MRGDHFPFFKLLALQGLMTCSVYRNYLVYASFPTNLFQGAIEVVQLIVPKAWQVIVVLLEYLFTAL
jgi:hypothetical protein